MAKSTSTQPKRKAKKLPSTLKYLNILEIKDNVVVMKDGSLRAVILVSSINFALKSEDEQNAIVSAYMGFLNSLSFYTQIVIHSRKLNIENYLNSLKQVEKEQTNDLLRVQITGYRQYIGELIEMGEIMTKRFYLVVPYDLMSDKQKTFMTRAGDVFSTAKMVLLSQSKFDERKHQLFQRVSHMLGSLDSMGLTGVLLDTQSLIELYYNTYNPETSENEKLVDINQLRIER
jgi:type IV secretory pathway VirB4 component